MISNDTVQRYSSVNVQEVPKCQIISNTMCRNEPFAVYGILSIIDKVDYVLVVDTGSDDGTFEELQQLVTMFPDKIDLRQIKLDNGHNWSIRDRNVIVEIPFELTKDLGDLRRYMHEISSCEWIWLLDGDEVYYEKLAECCHNLMHNDLKHKICIYLPFIDYVKTFGEVGQYHDMGRLFKKAFTKVHGNYPCEMHMAANNNEFLYAQSSRTLVLTVNNFSAKVQHFESILKPTRKNHSVIDTIKIEQLPEVFYKYRSTFPRIEKYL